MSVVAMMLHPDRVEAVELATQIASYLTRRTSSSSVAASLALQQH